MPVSLIATQRVRIFRTLSALTVAGSIGSGAPITDVAACPMLGKAGAGAPAAGCAATETGAVGGVVAAFAFGMAKKMEAKIDAAAKKNFLIMIPLFSFDDRARLLLEPIGVEFAEFFEHGTVAPLIFRRVK